MFGRIEQAFFFMLLCFGMNQFVIAESFQEIKSIQRIYTNEISSITYFNPVSVTDSIVSNSSKKKIITKKELKKKADQILNLKLIQPFYLRKDIAKYTRIEQGNSVSTNSYAINNRSQPSNLGNMVSFNLFDKGLNIHSFSGTQSTMYPLNFTFENTVNTKLDLFGFEYRFRSNESKSFSYSIRARLERDTDSDTYYQLGLNTHWKREKRKHNFGLEHFPVRSGPGHILEIYRTRLASYHEFQVNANLKQIAIIESNYYSDQQIDATISARTEYGITAASNFKISPLIELGYGKGTVNRRDSYPYWMADQRAFGGGGVVLALGTATSKFQMIADASLFGEINQTSFERYTGNLSYRIQNFTTIHAGFEVYTIENFYSNVAQLGMVYNFE